VDVSELLKILVSGKPSVELDARREEVFVLVPELRPLVGMSQNSHHEFDGWKHTILTVDGVRADQRMRLTALLHDVGKPGTRAPHPKRPGEFQFLKHEEVGAAMALLICRRLGLDEQGVFVCNLINWHVEPLHLILAGCPPKGVRRFLRLVGGALPDLLELARADINGSGVGRTTDDLHPLLDAIEAEKDAQAKAERDRLRITGEELMTATGLTSGRELGKLIDQLKLYVQENPEGNTKEALLEKARLLHQGS
jgi:poly(A) polymerase